MQIKGKFIFAISDEYIDFEIIENQLPLKPVKVVRKGQTIGKSNEIKAPLDIFSIERPILDNDNEDIFNQLLSLVNDLIPYCEFIKSATNKYDSVAINCYLRSDLGQIGFEINNEIITKIGSLGLKINFHILSFGQAE